MLERVVTTYGDPGSIVSVERTRWNDDFDDSFEIAGKVFERTEAEALWAILGQALEVEPVAKTA
jgi:hypothetical protein